MGSQSGENRSLEVGFGRPKAPKAPKAPKPDKAPPQPEEPKAAKPPKQLRARKKREPLGVWTSSIITGLLVGIALVAGSSVALDACANLRGTDSCGNIGLPLLLVILGLAVALGGALLRALARTTNATSTSFLAVAFVAVVVGLFLLDAVDGWAAVVIVPVLTILGYVGSHWVMTTYIEPPSPTVSAEVSAPDRSDRSAEAEPGPPAES
jgi:hypothetical protein